MTTNSATLQIAIEVDDRGSVKIRQLGRTGQQAGDQVESGFRKGRRSMADFNALAATTGKTLGVVAAGVAAASAAVTALVAQQARQAREMESLAKLAGMAAQEFEAYAYSTRQVGINAENLADISKDVKDKLGDFIATGGGEFADFFEQVAPKVGITAQELAKLSGPDVLVAVKKAMDDANVSAAEQVFYLESIGNDASKLIPLLEQEGAALQEQAERARDLGLALNEVDHQRLLEAQKATDEWAGAFEGMKRQIAAEFAPLYTSAMSQAVEWTLRLKDTVVDMASSMVNVVNLAVEDVPLAFILLVDKVMTSWISLSYGGREAALLITSAFGVMADDVLEIMAAMLSAIASKIESVNFTVKNPFGEDWNIGFEGAAASLNNQAESLRNASTANEDYRASITQLLKERQRALGLHEEVIAAMVEDVLTKDQATSATKTFAGATGAATGSAASFGEGLETTTEQLKEYAKELERASGEQFAEGMAAANQRAVAYATDRVEAQLQLETELNTKIHQLTSSELEYKQWALEQEIATMRDVAGEDADLQDQISRYRLARLEEMRQGTNQLADYMADRWREAYDSIQSTLAEFIKTGEFSFNSILDLFKNMLAEMLGTWLMYVGKMVITDLFTGGNMSWGQILGLSGGSGINLGSVLSAGSTAKSGYGLLQGGGTGWLSGPTSGGALGSAGNLATYGSAAYSAWTSGVGTVSSWYAGLQAAEMGVNAGTQLALIEGTYGAAQSGAAAGAAQAVAETTTTSTAAGGTAGISGGVAGLGVFGAFMAGVMALDAIGHNSGYDRETISTGVGGRVLGGVVDPNQDSIISRQEMGRDIRTNIEHIQEYAEAISYSGDRASEAGSLVMNTSQATALLEQSLDRAGLELEVLAYQFGDSTAQMALALDGETQSTIAFIDTLTGYSLSIDEAARLNSLATQAADGSAIAFDTLYSSLLGLTGNAEEARIALLGMVNAVSTLSSTPLSIDVAVNATATGPATIASTSVLESTTAIDPWWLQHSKTQESYAVGGIQTGAGIGAYANQIVDRPTLFPFARGIGLMGEAGPEAIMPLKRMAGGDLGVKVQGTASGAMDKLLAKLDALADRPIVINFNGDAAALRKFVRVEADKLRVEVNDADLDPLQRAVY